MPSAVEADTELTLADLFERFGPMPASRIRRTPAPGTATARDALAIHRREGKMCELVDGVLVEKAMGYEESLLAVEIIFLLESYIRGKKLGVIASEGGMFRLSPQLMRIPDVSFVSLSRLPGGKPPRGPMPAIAPNLAVEILSKSNTDREMSRRLSDYFESGVELVWFVEPRVRTIKVYTSRDKLTVLKGSQVLTGGIVLPGFKVRVADIFKKLDEV